MAKKTVTSLRLQPILTALQWLAVGDFVPVDAALSATTEVTKSSAVGTNMGGRMVPSVLIPGDPYVALLVAIAAATLLVVVVVVVCRKTGSVGPNPAPPKIEVESYLFDVRSSFSFLLMQQRDFTSSITASNLASPAVAFCNAARSAPKDTSGSPKLGRKELSALDSNI